MSSAERQSRIIPLDLEFQGEKGAISVYLIPYGEKAVLIECGPGSTQSKLTQALSKHHLAPQDITHVFLTHIHLDHAGAAGWLAQHGAQIMVHNVGAPHMLAPDRLLRSAGRIYGDQMKPLWGDFLPVPKDKLVPLYDSDRISIAGMEFVAIDTPGHANHHMAYLFEDTCFCGDIGGVRAELPAMRHLRLPTPPPEFHPGRWLESIEKLEKFSFNQIALTHFGIYTDPQWHLNAVRNRLHRINQLIRKGIELDLSKETFRVYYRQWILDDYQQAGIKPKWLFSVSSVNPADMSADGIYRYWKKHVAE